MASPSRTANKSRGRTCRSSRLGLAASALLVFASLSSASVPHHHARHPEITSAAKLEPFPTGIAVPIPADDGQLHELRVREENNKEDGSESTSSESSKSFVKVTSAPKDDKPTTTQDGKNDKPTTTKAQTVTGKPTGALTSQVSSASPLSSSSTAAATSPLPSAFDQTPISTFKTSDEDDSCPDFMSGLLSNSTYKECYPMSMMLQTSDGLFEAEKQLTSIVRVLDATCAPDVNFCSQWFSDAAQNLTKDENCGAEFNAGLTQVTQAYLGLRAYEMVYTATCLQDPDADMYCFASAVTNVTAPDDTYLYFMPYGLDLPGGSTPTCDWCTEHVMDVWHSASADRSQAIADVYEDAAQQVNQICGLSWSNSTLPEAETAAAPMDLRVPTALVMAVGMFALLEVFL